MALRKKVSILLSVIIVILNLIQDPFNLQTLHAYYAPLLEHKGSTISFLSGIELRKKQRQSLEEELAKFKKKTEEDVRIIVETIEKINKELADTKKRFETTAIKQELEYLNKKITLLNDRKQNLLALQDIFKEIEEVFSKRIKVIGNLIEFLQTDQRKVIKTFYTWQEFKDAQTKASELSSVFDEEKAKKETLSKQVLAEKDTIASLQKQVEVKIKERDKVSGDAKTAEKKALDLMLVKQSEDVFNEEINFLKEKIDYIRLKIEKIEYESKLKDDSIELLSHQVSFQKNTLMLIEERLIIDQADVEEAKAESVTENQKVLNLKDEINRKIDNKKMVKNKLDERSEFLTKQLKELENKGKKDSAESFIIKSELQKFMYHRLVLEAELDVLHATIELADDAVNTKDLFYQTVDLRYKLIVGKENVEELLTKFKNQKDIALNFLKSLKDKRKLAMDALVASTKELEVIKTQEEALQKKPDVTLKAQNEYMYRAWQNLEEARRYLHDHLQLIHNYLVINSDLIISREKIINQYDLIIQDLETRFLSQGIWKRSPKAISFDEFKTSLIEAETFCKQLFWDTPAHLGPTVFLKALKKINFMRLLALLFFILFYIFSFFGIHYLLNFLLKKLTVQINQDLRQISLLPLNIIIALLNFALDHIGLLFLWFFIYLHIIFDFSYVFASIDFFAQPYYLALFHIISIPLLVYLSQALLGALKELNKRLSFLFFAEKLQDRFLLLITFFCYSTAILIPLRQAFLSYYRDQHTFFPEVILAAYSLILVVVLLLFFSKEDVLRLIPLRYSFFAWIKKYIDKHYYPVFFFLMGLLIISNPYIGYLNLAWFLAFAIPSTALIFYTLFVAHYYIRKYAVFLFMKEEEDEIIDKFEHAKTYYGFLVIFSFLFLLGLALFVSTRIWGFTYAFADIWIILADVWVMPLGAQAKFGFVQFSELVIFIVAGFIFSSLFHKFVLNKLFDILRTEPGTQNTISKILHYAIICIATLLGFIFIRLENLIWYIGTLLAVGLGLALKDIITDYVAGLFVLIERPIEIGHYVRLNSNPDIQGVVHKIDARTTTIMTKLNHSLVIPNKDLANNLISNWGKGRFAIGFEIMVRVDYKSDPDLVRQSIAEVVQSNPTILRVPRIIIRLEEFEESALYFLVRAFISSRRVQEQWNIAAAIREDIFKIFREKNIQFAFPQRVLHMSEKDINGVKPQSPIQFKFDQ